MPRVQKMLGQVRPSNTNNTLLYSPEKGKTAVIKSLHVCNTTANTPTFRIFHDYSGGVADQSTALYYDVSLAASETMVFEFDIPISRGGQVFVRSSANDEITFTAYGLENS